MNNLRLHTRKNRGYFLALISTLVLAFSLSSCSKKDDAVSEPVPLSFITFVQSLPDYSSLDFYVGGSRTTSALLYTQSSGSYLGFYSGTYPIQVGIGGTNTQLFIASMPFENYANYSFFVTTKSATVDSVSAIVIKDDLTNPTGGKAKVRFVNVGRSTTAFDLGVQNGTTLFSNKAYNTYTDFMEVNPGTYTYTLKDAGTNNVRATSTPINIEGNKVYTLWASGTSSGTANKALTIQVMVNK